MPWYCPDCHGRTTWCYWCKVRHCKCKPHMRTRKTKDYVRKVHTIRRQDGQTRFMSARRYAHLIGAQKGGRTTATRPNPGRFDSNAARKAAQARWQGRHRLNRPTGLRLGMRRKIVAPTVSRQHLRYLYSRAPRLGIRYLPVTGQWIQVRTHLWLPITERTALRRLGHLNYARKNWVPDSVEEPIVATTVGTDPATRKRRRTTI